MVKSQFPQKQFAEIILRLDKFFGPKNFWSGKNFSQKIFGYEKIVELKNLLCQKVVSKNFFCPKFFMSKKFFSPKIFVYERFFESENLLF